MGYKPFSSAVADRSAPSLVAGLPGEAADYLSRLWKVWDKRYSKNLTLNVYYDGHRAFQDMGISIPPQMAKTRAALGWPAKAVTALARKHVFEGFSLDGQNDAFDAAELLAANDFEVELAQAITSAYKHSCAFLTVTAGESGSGEPPVVISARDALMSAALWDQRRRQISAFLAITSVDEDTRRPDQALLYLPNETWQIDRTGPRWSATALGNSTGRVLVEPLVYDPQIGRPFGRSRITREVRYLTDAAIRTLVRAEVAAEFFTAPQRWVLGVDPDAVKDMDRWSALVGRINVLAPNENGDTPQVQQMPQMSMSPHLETYRQLAQNFCAATGLPTSSVGIFSDNPTSAEAMQAAEAALADEAEAQWRIFTGPLRRLLQDVVMVRDGLPEPPAGSWGTTVRWTPARYASPAASADFALKMVQAFPQLQESAVLMRRAGLTEADLDEIASEQQRAGAASVLDRLTQATTTGQAEAGDQDSSQDSGQPTPPPREQQGRSSQDMKSAFDALGVAVRAGVDPDSALQALGLDGVRMTGAVPVSLRLPEKDTVDLEEA